jgi:hypothetical protein
VNSLFLLFYFNTKTTQIKLSGFWLRLADDVGTVFQQQNEYVYIPDLNPQEQI